MSRRKRRWFAKISFIYYSWITLLPSEIWRRGFVLVNPWFFKSFPVAFFTFPHVLLCRCHGFQFFFNVTFSTVFTYFPIAFSTDFPVVFFYGFPKIFLLSFPWFSTCFYVAFSMGFHKTSRCFLLCFPQVFLLLFLRSFAGFPVAFSMGFHSFFKNCLFHCFHVAFSMAFQRFSRCLFHGFPQVIPLRFQQFSRGFSFLIMG